MFSHLVNGNLAYSKKISQRLTISRRGAILVALAGENSRRKGQDNDVGIRLIAFDLDGTLLDDEKRLPGDNLAALTAAAEKGIIIVAATGRTYDGVPEVVRSLPFIRYYITCNGAGVYDTAEGTELYKSEIDPDTAVRLCRHMDTRPAIYDCYQNGRGWVSQRFYDQAADYIPNRGIYELYMHSRTPVPELKDTLAERGQGVQKLQMHFRDPEARLRELRELPGLFPELLVTSALATNIEINSRGANKGSALLALCRVLGIEAADTLAFGDGTNDLTMLQAAGTGVAMANAEPEVKAAADLVTVSNNDCGVAKIIWEQI